MCRYSCGTFLHYVASNGNDQLAQQLLLDFPELMMKLVVTPDGQEEFATADDSGGKTSPTGEKDSTCVCPAAQFDAANDSGGKTSPTREKDSIFRLSGRCRPRCRTLPPTRWPGGVRHRGR